MQVVQITKQIVEHKVMTKVIPAHATEFEIYSNYRGTIEQMCRELNLAVANGSLIEGRTLNCKYYKLNSDRT